MSALAVRTARITRDCGRSAPEWDITVLEQASATAEVRLGILDGASAGGVDGAEEPRWTVEVFVGDEAPSGSVDDVDDVDDGDGADDADGGQHGCFTSVTCLNEQRVRVRSCSAPPALLVGRAGAELVPSAPCSAGGAVVDDDHRLLVLSAAAYETLPRALVILLREFPSRFLRSDPVALLETLFADIPVGSAALISPMRTTSPVDRPPCRSTTFARSGRTG